MKLVRARSQFFAAATASAKCAILLYHSNPAAGANDAAKFVVPQRTLMETPGTDFSSAGNNEMEATKQRMNELGETEVRAADGLR
jgi:hypothetical protein